MALDTSTSSTTPGSASNRSNTIIKLPGYGTCEILSICLMFSLVSKSVGIYIRGLGIDYSLTHSVTHSLTQLLTHSVTQLLTHSVTQLLSYSVTHSLSHSHTHSVTQSLSHSVTHRITILIYNHMQCSAVQ